MLLLLLFGTVKWSDWNVESEGSSIVLVCAKAVSMSFNFSELDRFSNDIRSAVLGQERIVP